MTVSASTATATSDHEPSTGIEIGPKRTGFQDLPREIKDTIYFMVLRPDCKTDFEDFCGLHHDCIDYTQGRTNLLLLCSGVYTEAVELLHQHENVLVLSGKKGSLFRNARDFGRPGKFTHERRGSTCYIPSKFCELQVLRFRALAVCVVVPKIRWAQRGSLDLDRLSNLESEIEQLTITIKKSRHLQTLRILIKRHFDQDEEWITPDDERKNEKDMVATMRPLVNAAIEVGIKFAAEEDRMYRPKGRQQGGRIVFKDQFGDPLVSWLNLFTPTYLRPKFKFEYRMNTDGVYLDDFGDSEVIPFDPPYCGCGKLLFPVECVEEEDLRLRAQYNRSRPTVKYQLLPECRSCYSLFSTWEDLKQHLVNLPKHKTPFQTKVWNTIRDDAAYGEKVKCHWCAYQPPPGMLYVLEEHYQVYPWHEIDYIIPRWKEDNWRYARKAKMITLGRERAEEKRRGLPARPSTGFGRGRGQPLPQPQSGFGRGRGGPLPQPQPLSSV